jgi:hypothetical protein
MPSRPSSGYRHRLGAALQSAKRKAGDCFLNALVLVGLFSGSSSSAQTVPATFPDAKLLKEGGVTEIQFQQDGRLIISPPPGLGRRFYRAKEEGN